MKNRKMQEQITQENFNEIVTRNREMQEMKKTVSRLSEENSRLKDAIQRMSEQLNNSARKEDLLILQRQLDLLRE